jgi:D-alanyl-D-alanine carboxypeptidase
MKKKIFIALGIIILFAIVIYAWAFYIVNPNAQKVADFIKKHPNKAAIYFVRNDTAIVSQNADTIMPLASTVKIMVAIEFAKQASAKKINIFEEIDTLELDKYYLPESDGGAHPEWLNDMHAKHLLHGSKISLLEVAKGMIRYSSNANTEYLMDKLGFENLNNLRDSLGIENQHQLFYPIVGALLLCQKTKPIEVKQYAEELQMMTMDEYRKKCFEYHELLKNTSNYKQHFNINNIGIDLQKIWSLRLIGASCKAYVSIMQKINSRSYFDSITQNILDQLLEWPMAIGDNSKNFKHFGAKGGSTGFLLTEALYTTDFKNNSNSMAVFFNNLTALELMKMQSSLNEFEFKMMIDDKFRNNVVGEIGLKN